MSDWLARLKAGDDTAAQPLWELYFSRLVALARSRMTSGRTVADEEDVALSAFDSFCRGAQAGRFPRLNDRDDLWRVIVVIVHRKVSDHAQHGQRLKRGGGADFAEIDWEDVLGSDPTPAFAAEVAEQCERLMARLGEESLRSVANLKMEGYTTEEIADKLGCAPRTVERRLQMIRDLWSGEAREPA